MKQKNCFFAVAASLLIAAASFTSCSNQDNIIAPNPQEIAGPDEFDEGSLITNGRCEGTETANFFVHEWRSNDEMFRGAANIKWDEVTPRNHAIVVEARSEGEARSAGNATLTDGKFQEHDTQFFITIGKDQVLEKGDQIRVTMKVKADEAQNGVGTQSHAAPGEYLHWFGIGNVNFTTEWTDFDSNWITVDGATPWAQAMPGMYTIAFNLAKGIRNRYFFDDIRVEVKRHDKWADDNIITNGRISGEDMTCFTSAEWVNGEKVTASPEAQGNARRVVDVTDPDNFCIEVISRDQPEGSSIDNWDTQFFVTMPEAVNEGDTMYFEARVRAEKEASSETQAHTAPTTYKHWAFVGNIPFTTEWATYTNELVVASNQAGCNTIAVNLAVFKEANKYYFDDIKIVVKKAKPVENWETLCEYAGDDATGFSVKYFKNYTDAAKVVDGAIVVESLDPEKTYTEYNNGDAEAKVSVDWDTQFLIPLPKKLAAGTKAKITMKIKADKEIKQVDSQAHGTIPAAGAIEGVDGYAGTYLHYDLFGKVDFLTDWGTFEKEFTVPEQGNDMQSICFNLEKLREVNKYYFKEIKVEVSK